MKKFFVVSFVFVFVLIACKKEEPLNLEAFSPQGFAYDLGDVWEVNASVRVKGFQQNRDDETEEVSASVYYNVDLEKPNGEIKENIFKYLKDVTDNERIMDIALESQFELGTDYEEGTYKLIYHIKDELSGMQTVAVVEIELQE